MQPLKTLLNASLVRQARLYDAMTESLRRRLPAEAASRCWIGGVREQTLVVVTDSASFTIAARYQQRDILKGISAEFRTELATPLVKLKIKVAKAPVSTNGTPEQPKLSVGNARELKSTAAHTADPELKSALIRLARRGEKR